MQIKSFFQTMSDGYELWVNRWMPDNEEDIKGVIQLHHGLAEHSMRYDRLGSILADAGFVFNAYDFRGHGKTAENAKLKGKGDFGVLADKNGFTRVVDDLSEMINSLKDTYKGKKVLLIGHSFGSFISQSYIERYGEDIDACTLCGTAGPRPAVVGAGHFVINIYKCFHNPLKPSAFIEKLAFGSYNNKIENVKTKYDWISKSDSNVQMYIMDKWCGFDLPVCFYKDMMDGLNTIHKSKNIKNIPVDLPINFIYGTDDPVGTYGKTIQKLYDIYKKNGIKTVEIKGYEGDRHEIFNEDDKETVENDFVAWANRMIAG